jgi:hypothetical protein
VGQAVLRRPLEVRRRAAARRRALCRQDPTHGIERDHARQRHRLARFRRRAIVVSKAERMVDASIALIAAFGNDKRQILLSMSIDDALHQRSRSLYT